MANSIFNVVQTDDGPRRYDMVAGMYHLSGLEWPLGRINDPSTPIAEAQDAVYQFAQKVRPGIKLIFLGLKHDQHNHIETLSNDQIPSEGFISIPTDGIVCPNRDDVALAVFVGDCVAMRATGKKYKALVHYGWQEAADGTGRNFRQKWLDLGENTVTADMRASMGIGFHDLPLNGLAISRLQQAGLGFFLLDDGHPALPTSFDRPGLEGYKFCLPDALAYELNPDAELIDGVAYATYMHYTRGNTFTDGFHASDRAAKMAGTLSHRDCYIVM